MNAGVQRLDLLEDVRTHVVHGIARNQRDLIDPERALAVDEIANRASGSLAPGLRVKVYLVQSPSAVAMRVSS